MVADLRVAAERRAAALLAYEKALQEMNEAVRLASQGGMPAVRIAEEIGTSRQRVYEILRAAVE